MGSAEGLRIFRRCYIVGTLTNKANISRGVARNLLRGTKEGVWRTEVSQWGPAAEPLWGVGAKPSEAGEIC